jgi:hypothetical protein
MINSKHIPEADQSWAAAEKMLDRHFRNKRILYWSLSIAIPSLVVGLTLMFSHLNKSNVDNHVIPFQTEQAIHTTASNSNSNIQSIASSKTNNKVTENNFLASSNNIIAPVTNNNDIKRSGFNSAVSDQNEKKTKGNNNNSSSKTSNEGMPLTISASIIGNQKANINYHQKDNINNQNTSNLNTQDEANSSSTGFYSVSGKNKSIESEGTVYAFLKPKPGDLMFEQRNNHVMENKFPLPDKKSSYSHVVFEVSAYGGVNYIQKNITGNEEWNNYLQHRKNEEEAIVAPSIGISMTANLNSLSIRAGIEYSQYGEKTNYYPYSNQLTIDDNSTWQLFMSNYVDTDTAYIWGNQHFFETVRQRADSMYVVDYDSTEEYKYDENIAKNNGTNKIYYVEIPVEVSYVLNKGRMGFGISGGIAPAFLSMERGHYLRKDGRGIESFEEIESFRKFLMNGRVGVDIYYRAGDRIKLMLRPQFKTNLNSIFESDYGVNQKYYSTGILFGVTYILN